LRAAAIAWRASASSSSSSWRAAKSQIIAIRRSWSGGAGSGAAGKAGGSCENSIAFSSLAMAR
jgi:hypothetical protein